ncbi:hypothetical protein QYE76_015169 [Lolium multiflorum]|uniref:Uncharacterized protein n=1 Tax=Lolium multiflorum TaxID=4521 RepID=A0AAD8U6G0_LOLMU|nr:hypothetical protein QYE76_015169 [Lolium multiflorum]
MGSSRGSTTPDTYSPDDGKFIKGLHPESMRKAGSDEFDYRGCVKAYREFVRTVAAYQAKLAVVRRFHVVVTRGRSMVTAAVPKLSHDMHGEAAQGAYPELLSVAKNMARKLCATKMMNTKHGATVMLCTTQLSGPLDQLYPAM